MESLNLYKSYDKVVDHDQPPPPSTPPRNPIAIFLIILSTVAIFTTIGALTHTKPPSQKPQRLSPDSIRAVCSVTHYPLSCFVAISNHTGSLPTSDPRPIFTLSLHLSLTEVQKLLPLPKSLILKANDKGTESALRDCMSLLDDAVSQLNESARVAEGGLTDEKVGDLNTWISAAMSDEETCVDGLDEVGSTVVDVVRGKMQRSKEFMSNTLAILSNMNVLLDKFKLSTSTFH